jgi:hypothetical protein
MSTTPSTELERALMIMHNITMVAQVMDDTVGRDIDQQLNIPSYGYAAQRISDGDKKIAKQYLRDTKRHYKSKVRDLGLGNVGRRSTFNLLRGVLEIGAFALQRGKTNDRVRNSLIKKMPIREKMYLEGTLAEPTITDEQTDRFIDEYYQDEETEL